MNYKVTILHKILLVIFVFIICWLIGWYGEKAVVKFFINNNLNEIQSY